MGLQEAATFYKSEWNICDGSLQTAIQKSYWFHISLLSSKKEQTWCPIYNIFLGHFFS